MECFCRKPGHITYIDEVLISYRIGQKNNVQVYKLITSNSIEEKIYELQQKKSELVDNMLSTKTSFISKFSRDEIMNLFE